MENSTLFEEAQNQQYYRTIFPLRSIWYCGKERRQASFENHVGHSSIHCCRRWKAAIVAYNSVYTLKQELQVARTKTERKSKQTTVKTEDYNTTNRCLTFYCSALGSTYLNDIH